MTANGSNPMRWKCDEAGCFNRLRRPKIEVFADCFPGRINFGDVDGVVELNGHFLYLEWKGMEANRELPVGQRIAFERRTMDGVSTVLVVRGNAETMSVSGWCLFHSGKQLKWHDGDIDDVKRVLKRWALSTQKRSAA